MCSRALPQRTPVKMSERRSIDVYCHFRMTFSKRVLAAAALIAFGVLGRLVPHLPDATPLTAITLMGSRYLGRTWSIVIPVAAMLASDLFIGFYDGRVLATVYLSFALIAAMSWFGAKRGLPTLLGTAATASLLFFLTTNAAVWAFSPWYAKSFGGLLEAYAMGLPFLGSMLLSDLLYTASLYGICEAIKIAVINRRLSRDSIQPAWAVAE